MTFRASKFGDWTKAGVVLQALSTKITPKFNAQLREDGELILKTMQEHIEAQDLNWTPLSEDTISRKGHDTIYVESGFLKDNLEVRKVKSPKNGVTLFVGASAWKRTEDGVKFSDLLIWLENGTDKIPPRPLIEPSWNEVEPIIKENWKNLLQDLINKGGS